MPKIICYLLLSQFCFAQKPYTAANIHSHNDYAQPSPFHNAFGLGCGSIEADVYLKDGQLLVAHLPEEVRKENTLKHLYLNPLQERISQNHGYPLQLMIDLKTPAKPTLDSLVNLLGQYPLILSKVSFVVSGNMPPSTDFDKYPSWILFDGRLDQYYTKQALARVALVSASLTGLVRWDGTRPLTANEQEVLHTTIDKVHSMGKKIRFWATPDTPLAWQALMTLGVDWIGTDHPTELSAFLKAKE